MPFDYTLTYDDFKDAQKLFVRRKTSSWILYLFWLRVLPALSVPSVALLLYIFAGKHYQLPAWVPTVAAVIAWLGFFMLIQRPFTLRRVYKQLLPEGEKVVHATISFDEQQVISSIPGHSEGRIYWTAFHKFLEDDKMGLLLLNKKRFLIVPKRAMPEDQWQLVRDYISRSRKVA